MLTLHVTNLRRLASATLLAAALAGCSSETKPLPPEAAPTVAPEAAPAPPAHSATPEAPASDSTPSPESMPPDSAPPADTTPSPTDPSAVAKPTSARIPDLDSMKLAKTSGKLGVAADVRYTFDSAAEPNQPVMLNIAVVPRVAGQALEFSLQPSDGVRFAGGPVTRLKVNQTDTLRQQFSITRTSGTSGDLRVLVTHHWDGGSAFSFYSIPFD
jgi:hypothetical protein